MADDSASKKHKRYKKNLIPKLIKAVNHKKSAVSHQALDDIAAITDPAALDQLLEVLQTNDNPSVCCAVAKALSSIGDSRAFEPILQHAMDHRDTPKGYLEHLKKLTGAQNAERIVSLLSDSQYEFHTWAANEIVNIGEPGIPYLLRALPNASGDGRARIISSLNKLGSKEAVNSVLEYLNDENRFIRLEACRLLQNLGDDQYTEKVISTVERDLQPKSDWKDKDSALSFLGSTKHPKVLKTLIRVWQDEKEDTYIRQTAWLQLTRMLPKQELDHLTTYHSLSEKFLKTLEESKE